MIGGVNLLIPYEILCKVGAHARRNTLARLLAQSRPPDFRHVISDPGLRDFRHPERHLRFFPSSRADGNLAPNATVSVSPVKNADSFTIYTGKPRRISVESRLQIKRL
jgi:hypothetical protein